MTGAAITRRRLVPIHRTPLWMIALGALVGMAGLD